MHALAEYIISVSAAAILCGILNSLMLKGAAKEIMKLVSGLFLAFCVISPVSNIRLPELTAVGEEIRSEAETAAEIGEAHTREALADSISRQLEAYILDKAEEMGLHLDAEIVLGSEETFLPERVVLSGEAAPGIQKQLIREIAEDLGIPEEDVQWSGRQ